MYQTIHTDTAAGFDIVVSIADEHLKPDWDFENEEDKQDTLRRIENGNLVYFIARVQALKNGIVLGTDYLGGCCYDSYMQFVNVSGYYADMVESATTEARATITKLIE